MRRFVYTPQVQAFIKTRTSANNNEVIFDVTEDIISGSVNRRLDAISDATLVLQNKFERYTGSIKIRPMDRIAIRLGRIGPTMLVFSGYVDNAPYYQLYPGPVTIQASCTLKLLHNSFFDPGLPYLQEFWMKRGWNYNPNSGEVKPLGDLNKGFGNQDIQGSIADILSITMQEIGGWDNSKIAIGKLPDSFLALVAKQAKDSKLEKSIETEKTLKRLQSMFNVAEGTGITSDQVAGDAVPAEGTIKGEVIGKMLLDAGFSPSDASNFLAIANRESSLRADACGFNGYGAGFDPDYQGSFDLGLFQINSKNLNTAYAGFQDSPNAAYVSARNHNRINHLDAGIQAEMRTMFDPNKCIKRAKALYDSAVSAWGDGYHPWRLNGEWKGKISDKSFAWARETIKKVLADPSAFAYTAPTKTTSQTTNPSSRPDEGTTGPNANDKQTASDKKAQTDAQAAVQPNKSIATKIIQIANSQIGKAPEDKGANNGDQVNVYQDYTVQGTWYRGANAPWCACFVTWVYGMAGLDLRPRGKGQLAAAVAFSRLFGTVSAAAMQPGDIIYFNRDQGHVGVVTSRNGNNFETVEGNSGDNVTRHTRSLTDDEASVYVFTHLPEIGTADADAASGSYDPSDATSTGNLAGTFTGEQIFDIATQASATLYKKLSLPSTDSQLSQYLRGDRALANDIALIEWIKSMVQSSGRRYMSMPDGKFYAFFPDYFGWFKRTPYFRIADIEILDLNIQRDDKELTTHVFTWGNSYKWDTSMPLFDVQRIQVASVEEPDFSKFIGVNPDDPLGELNALASNDGIADFLDRHGARPLRQDKLDIRIPEMLWMSSWTLFLQKWSEQFTTSASFTFLPEILPGGLVNIGDKITMFVESVTHNFDREGGFTTTAQLTSPARIGMDRAFGELPISSNDAFNSELIKSVDVDGEEKVITSTNPNLHAHDRPGRGD